MHLKIWKSYCKNQSITRLQVRRCNSSGGRQILADSAVLRGLWSFVRSYVMRAGFWMAAEGFMLAVSNAGRHLLSLCQTDAV